MSLLELEDVVKHYAAARSGSPEAGHPERLGQTSELVRAVDGISLAVHEGEMVAIHGPSGSGKTTLLLLTATLLVPGRGSIRYRGRSLSSFSEADTSAYLRHDIGFVYQSFQLMPGVTALENATLKLLLDGIGPRKARAQARPWLERLGMGERLAHTSEQLSGGERQRVAIARALVGDPKLILADEPTGNLDSRRSLQTVALLREIAHEQGAGVLLVTHDREAAALADRDYMLRDGRLSPVRGHDADSGGGSDADAKTDPDARARHPLPVS
ncbi:MAG TPA: ABC transporter ATP-binding protein [Solirubrobacteraceae bacterium]|jgi:putative ABC transport system ATP-binding protein|nr:ABC transporter ATP-binding protein [Solirubrobacteraceae bacterium]